VKTSLRIALLVPFLVAACGRSKTDNKPLPTPMNLGPLATPTSANQTPIPMATIGGRNSGNGETGSNRPPIVTSIEIQGTGGGGPGAGHPNAGDTLKVVYAAQDPDGDLVSTKARWLKNNQEIGQGETLSPGSFKKNEVVTVELIVTDSKGASVTRTMTAAIRNSPPTFTSLPTGLLAGYHPTATDPDGDAVTIEMSPMPGFGFDGGTVTVTDNAVAITQKGKMLNITAKDADNASTTQSIVINL